MKAKELSDETKELLKRVNSLTKEEDSSLLLSYRDAIFNSPIRQEKKPG